MALSTAHFEHGLPILADLDLGALASGFQAAQAGDLNALQGVLQAFGKVGQLKLLRRLVAVSRATVPQLLEAETQEDGLADLEAAVAAVPFKDALTEAMGFFEQLGFSLSPTVPSSKPEDAPATKPRKGKAAKVAILSAAS